MVGYAEQYDITAGERAQAQELHDDNGKADQVEKIQPSCIRATQTKHIQHIYNIYIQYDIILYLVLYHNIP